MTENEMVVYEKIKSRHNLYYLPFVWATSVIERARNEDRMKHDSDANELRVVSMKARLETSPQHYCE